MDENDHGKPPGGVRVVTEDEWIPGPRRRGWSRRLVHPIDAAEEIWVAPETRPDFADWQAANGSNDLDIGAASVGLYMSGNLLQELSFAGGAVELEVDRFHRAMDAAQELWDASESSRTRTPEAERAPGFTEHVSTTSLAHAHIAFCNVLTWTRTVEERVDRPYRPGKRHLRAGLLANMARGARREQVQAALVTFQDRTAYARRLSNYVLHAGASFVDGSVRAEVPPEGRLILRLPDDDGKRIVTWTGFRFTQDRDMRSHAEELLEAVDELIDSVISAFEEHVPERFQD